MPEFFVPTADSPAQAEQVWTAARKFAADQTGWDIKETRIFRIEYVHNGQHLEAEVGKPDPLEGEIVLVILESNSYLVCTPNRGVLRGHPILAGRPSHVEEFSE